MLSERDLEIADEWIRENVFSKRDQDFDDVEENGDTLKYYFHRHADRATVVYLVCVRRGKVYSIQKEVYHEETEGDKPDEAEWLVQGGEKRGEACR